MRKISSLRRPSRARRRTILSAAPLLYAAVVLGSTIQAASADGPSYAQWFKGDVTPYPYQYPDSATGKLFFRVSGSPNVNWCSAAVIGSSNVVATAGHCVMTGGQNGRIGKWHGSFVFVPGYRVAETSRSGNPKWYPSVIGTTGSWAYHSDFRKDVAYMKMYPRTGGTTIASTTGSLGMVWGEDPRALAASHVQLRATGYPLNVNNGDRMRFCNGPLFSYDRRQVSQNYIDLYKVQCDMKAGSSGGPWKSSDNISHSVTVLSSVFGDEIFGPALGSAALDAYRAVGGGA